MILGDYELNGRLHTLFPRIEDHSTIRVGPASIDLTLGDQFLKLANSPYLQAVGISQVEYSTLALPSTDDEMLKRQEFQAGGADLGHFNVIDPDTGQIRSVYGLKLWPGAFVLAQTKEFISISKSLVGRVEGRSGIARLGIIIHTTAGFLDPGFYGNITLEIANFSQNTYVLPVGERVCQVAIEEVTLVEHGYAGSYQGSQRVEGSKLKASSPSQTSGSEMVY